MSAADEVGLLAANLARNCRYATFPCREDKSPATPNGFKDASRDPAAIARLWRAHPGPLVGIATGSRSGVSVLDVDQKHPEAVLWWRDNHTLLLPTRCFATRSGGVHLFYMHAEGLRCSAGRICPGVDVRGDGGYIISWWCAGHPCLDQSPPAAWPIWLLLAANPPPQKLPPQRTHAHADARLEGLLRTVSEAAEGERNSRLFWAALRCIECGMRQSEIEALLLPTAIGTGLHETEARRCIASAGRTVA